jgi:hypothetical protein
VEIELCSRDGRVAEAARHSRRPEWRSRV